MPQRRDRIYLVADFAGRRAGKVLFEQESLRGHPAPGAAPGQGASADTSGSAGGSGKSLWGQSITNNPEETSGAPSPSASSLVCNESGQGYWMPGFGSLRAEGENRPSRPSHLVCFAQNQRVEVRDLGDQAGAIAANPGIKQQSYLAYRQGNGISRAGTAECDGCGWQTNISCAPNTIDRHAVCYQDTVGALCTADWRGSNNQYVDVDKLVVDPFCTDARGNGEGNVCSTITGDHENRITDYTNIVTYGGDKAGTLDASYYKGPGARNGNEREFVAVKQPGRKYVVRRLTTTECARLQGLPDRWAIPLHKKSFTDEEGTFWERVRRTHAEANGRRYRPYAKREQLVCWYNRLRTDSSEYKLYGNGIALPCAAFVLRGVAMAFQE